MHFHIIICNDNDAPQLRSLEMYSEQYIFKNPPKN